MARKIELLTPRLASTILCAYLCLWLCDYPEVLLPLVLFIAWFAPFVDEVRNILIVVLFMLCLF